MAKRTEQELNTLISRACAQVAAMDDREGEIARKQFHECPRMNKEDTAHRTAINASASLTLMK